MIRKYKKELALTHALLFARNRESLKIGTKFYGAPINDDESYFRDLDRRIFLDLGSTDSLLGIKDFEIFGKRIVIILNAMEEWHPRNFWQLFTIGYTDRMTWWVAMFGMFFGVISILIFMVGLWTAIVAQKQYLLTANPPLSG